MEKDEDLMPYEVVCSGCEHLLKVKWSNCPVCKIGKFKEMDMANRQCPNKSQ